jgi:hypothetical protein
MAFRADFDFRMAEYRVQVTVEVTIEVTAEVARWYRDPCHCSLGAAATCDSPRRSGRTEKNLCRQGSQRNAGSFRIRQKMAVACGTCSAEIRCNSKLPQIPQWA